MDEECISTCRDYVLFSIGFYSGGCGLPEGEPGIEIINDTTIKIIHDNIGIVISEDRVGDGVWINDPRKDMYIHRRIRSGKTINAYMSNKPINKYLLAGLIKCMLSREGDIDRAIDKALELASMGEGEPIKYLNRIYGEYNCYMRTLNAVNRLINYRELLKNLITREAVIGCRSQGSKTVFKGRILGERDIYFKLPIEPYNIEINRELEDLSPGGFVCIDRLDLAEKLEPVEKYGYRLDQTEEYLCIIGDDPVRIVILLEKIVTPG